MCTADMQKEHPSDVLRLRKDRYHIRIIKDDTALHKFCFSVRRPHNNHSLMSSSCSDRLID